MSTFTKAMLILVLPTILISDCVISTHLKFNREFDIFSAAKRAESIQHASPNRNYRSNIPEEVQRCGDRLKKTIKVLCRGQLATLQQTSTGSFSTGGSRLTRYTRSTIIDECCRKPCMLTSLLKYCPVAPQRPNLIATPVPVHQTAKLNHTIMNGVSTVKQLNMSEETEAGKVLICFPKFDLEGTSDRVTDNLGNTWTKVIDSNNIDKIESGIRHGETQNLTLEAIEVPEPVVQEVVAEEESPAWGPESSEEISMFFAK